MRKNSLLIKICIKCIKQTFTKNCITRTERLLVSFIYVIFHISPGLLLLQINSSPLYQNEGEEIATTIWTYLSHSIRVPWLLSVKTIKIMMSITKLRHMRDTYIDQGICIFLIQMLKTVSISFINSELIRTLYLVWLLSNLQWKQ